MRAATGVAGLAYVELGHDDPAAWARYATDVLGATVVSCEDDDVRLAIDDRPERIRVRRGAPGDVLAVGWFVAGSAQLDTMRSRLDGAGLQWRTGSPQEAAERFVEEMILYRDPAGCPTEIVVEPPRANSGRDGFVTGDLGLGHITITVDDPDGYAGYVTDVLGMRLSDTISLPGRGPARFFHCNPRHHTLAVSGTPAPFSLGHLMIERTSLDAVGRGADRAATDWEIVLPLGRHTNDLMVSFYSRVPGGVAVELGWDGRLVDDDWEPKAFDAGSVWGHGRISIAKG